MRSKHLITFTLIFTLLVSCATEIKVNKMKVSCKDGFICLKFTANVYTLLVLKNIDTGKKVYIQMKSYNQVPKLDRYLVVKAAPGKYKIDHINRAWTSKTLFPREKLSTPFQVEPGAISYIGHFYVDVAGAFRSPVIGYFNLVPESEYYRPFDCAWKNDAQQIQQYIQQKYGSTISKLKFIDIFANIGSTKPDDLLQQNQLSSEADYSESL